MRHHHSRYHVHIPLQACNYCEEGCMPLSKAACMQCVRLVSIAGGRTLRKRLAELGLAEGCEVRIVQNFGGGPLILAVKEDARMAIGRGMAHKMIVQPVQIAGE